MRLAVLGSGGIGGYYGALLTKGGHDIAFIARGAHLEALQQRGLTVRTPGGESTIRVTAVADCPLLRRCGCFSFCIRHGIELRWICSASHRSRRSVNVASRQRS